MNNEQEEALRILFGETNAEVIKSWCRITQSDNTLKWMKEILLTEISECWDGDISDYPTADFKDKLILDRFFCIGLFNSTL
jgi:hypothetical protein